MIQTYQLPTALVDEFRISINNATTIDSIPEVLNRIISQCNMNRQRDIFTFTNSVLHGSLGHRQWLTTAALNHYLGLPINFKNEYKS